ncbi:MAG: glycoside hydrolase family 57 protein [Deltaproteobacteria bacterium]|nr:glycoside hydrolase family 57 protein [Deltaproteobacteria bacterium]
MPGIFALMLHSHIPYCRKSGVWPAGEEWLFEAMNETYIPLLRSLRSLYYDGIRPRTMIGLVPILMEQLADEYMKDRFCEYMEDKIRRARADIDRFRSDPAKQRVAHYWLERFEANYSAFTSDFHRDILGTLKWLQDEHVIEVVTSAATHGFLPLLENDSAVFAQIRIGVETYRSYFGCSPRGFWLPECAYRPEQFSDRDKRMRKGIDEWLLGEGIEYFFIESVGIMRASFVENLHQEAGPNLFRGYKLPSGVCVFGRNEATGKQVWSPETGYPGDPYYLEFHQKDPESGLHYTRVTGKDNKQVYDPEKASQRVEEHARHFAGLVSDIIDNAGTGVAEPVIVSPYDCELFGHWWHEGVDWLEKVYRELAAEDTAALRSLSEYLDQYRDDLSTITMEPSTWGLNSDYTVWLNPEHGWIWPYINSCSVKMEQILAQVRPSDERGERIIRQMARELLLMQGSDWPFLLFTTQAKEYANQRFHHHHQRFQKLIWAAQDLGDHKRLSETELSRIEDVDCPWQDLDWNIFQRRE